MRALVESVILFALARYDLISSGLAVISRSFMFEIAS